MRYLWTIALAMTAFFLISGLSSAADGSTGDIQGKVTTYHGNPVKYTEVQLLKNGTTVNTTMTDSLGEFEFQDISPGEYTLSALSNGYLEERKVYVSANKTTNVALVFPINTTAGDDDDVSSDDSGGLFVTSIFLFGAIILFVVAMVIIGIVIAYNYSKITQDRLMEHETRIKIFEHIQKDPGQHLRKIGSDLSLPMGVLTHHIGKLEKEEVIKSQIDGKFKRYYPWDFKVERKPWLSDIQNDLMLKIRNQPGISANDLVELAGGSRSNIYYHIAELEGKGLIRVDRQEKRHRCFPVQET